MTGFLRDLVTRAAIRWLEHVWERPVRIPDPDEMPQLDARDHPVIAFGPCVIRPPGLLIDFDGRFVGRQDRRGPILAFGTHGSRDRVDWLLDVQAVDTTKEV